MLYRLRATSLRFCEDEYKKLLEEYPCLANFDFKESPESVPTGSWIKDKDGNCTVWQEGPPETVYYPCEYGDGVAELIFHCPFWVRPLVGWFFSPSVYYREYGLDVIDGIVAGMGG